MSIDTSTYLKRLLKRFCLASIPIKLLEISAKFLRGRAEVLALPLRNIIHLSIKLATLSEECTIVKLKLILKKIKGLILKTLNLLLKKCPYSELFWSTFFPNFSVFGLNSERIRTEYSVSVCIQSECAKVQNRITPNTDTFYAVLLLLLLPKIIEKSIQFQIEDHLNEKKLIYMYQSGSRTNHSADVCLLQLIDLILSGMDKQMHTCIIFVDLQKVFDIFVVGVLLEKLKKIGFRKSVIK